MITTINNNERVFALYTENGDLIFCNLGDMGRICSTVKVNEIKHVWNQSIKRISKKGIKDILKSHGYSSDFHPLR